MANKRKTRNEKIKEGGKANSKYAKKSEARRRAALKLGLSRNATWPEIWAAEDGDDE